MRTVAVACLALLVVALLGCGLTRSRWWGGVLMLTAAAWLPLNNGQLEGPVLLGLTRAHGLTLADVGGVTALLVGALKVWPPRRWRSGSWLATRAGLVAALLAVGVGAAWTSTIDRHDERAGLRAERHAGAAAPRQSHHSQ